MKTVLDIPDHLLRDAGDVAVRDNTTLDALVEQGLRKIVTERSGARQFRLRDASFGGDGLAEELQAADWQVLRDLAYESHET